MAKKSRALADDLSCWLVKFFLIKPDWLCVRRSFRRAATNELRRMAKSILLRAAGGQAGWKNKKNKLKFYLTGGAERRKRVLEFVCMGRVVIKRVWTCVNWLPGPMENKVYEMAVPCETSTAAPLLKQRLGLQKSTVFDRLAIKHLFFAIFFEYGWRQPIKWGVVSGVGG